MSRFTTATLAFLALGAIILAISGASRMVRAGEAPTQGDATCDSAASPSDAAAILGDVAGVASPPCPHLADVNCDGVIGILDALRVLGHGVVAQSEIEGCSAVGAEWAEPVSSFALIDQDGSLDEGTAILYKAYAAFGDPRLPAEYASDVSSVYQEVPREIWERPEGLSAQVEEALDKYLLPPDDPGSWYSDVHAAAQPAGLEPPEWNDAHAAQHRYVNWHPDFPSDEALAAAIAPHVDPIYDRYKNLLLRTGHAVLNIYVTAQGPGVAGAAIPQDAWFETEKCRGRPEVTILINSGLPQSQIVPALARLLMQEIMWSSNFHDTCEDRQWFFDAMSAWAEDFIAPRRDTEHRFGGFFGSQGLPIQAWGKGDAYLYLLYLTRSFSPDLMETLMQRTISMTVLQALDETVPGSVAGTFPGFALQAWNQELWTMFRQWDGIGGTPPAGTVNVDTDLGKGTYTLGPLDAFPSDLSVQYLRLPVTDPDTRVIKVRDPFTGPGSEFISVQALFSEDGGWRMDEIPKTGQVSYCRAFFPIDEIILIIANAGFTGSGAPAGNTQPIVTFGDECALTGDYVGEVHAVQGTGGVTDVETVIDATDLIFRKIDSFPDRDVYQVMSGTVTYTVSGTNTLGCTAEGTSSGPVPSDGFLTLYTDGTYFGSGGGGIEIPVVYHCQTGDVHDANVMPPWWTSGIQPLTDVETLAGNRNNFGTVYEWLLTREN